MDWGQRPILLGRKTRMTNYKDSDWEKRFEKKFAWVSEAGSPLKAFVFPMQYNEVKSFLHQELDRARDSLRKKVEVLISGRVVV